MDNTPGLIDVMRVICLVAGSATVGATSVVIYAYMDAYRRHRRQAKAGNVPDWRGLLVRHVIGVAVSYNGLVLLSMYTVATRLRADLTWRSFAYTPLYLIGLWAMWEVFAYTRKREVADKSPRHDADPSPNR